MFVVTQDQYADAAAVAALARCGRLVARLAVVLTKVEGGPDAAAAEWDDLVERKTRVGESAAGFGERRATAGENEG